MKDYLDKKTGQTTFKVSKTSKVDYLIGEKRFNEALSEINSLIKEDASPENYTLKAAILDSLKEFNEACDAFDMALKIRRSDEVLTKKANTLYNWAKIKYFPESDHYRALDLIEEAIKTLPDNEDSSEYYFLKAEILEALGNLVEAQKAYLIAHGEFERLDEFQSQTDYLSNTEDTLISITGGNFYSFTPVEGMEVDLVREESNEHDPDAVAVFYENEKVGYVANSSYTLIDEVRSASSIKNEIKEGQKAEILFTYMGEYVIAKLKS